MFAVKILAWFLTVIVYHKVDVFSMVYSMNYSRIHSFCLDVLNKPRAFALCRLTGISIRAVHGSVLSESNLQKPRLIRLGECHSEPTPIHSQFGIRSSRISHFCLANRSIQGNRDFPAPQIPDGQIECITVAEAAGNLLFREIGKAEGETGQSPGFDFAQLVEIGNSLPNEGKLILRE